MKIRSFEQYQKDYKRSVEEPENFWAEVAGNFSWRKKWDRVLKWNFKEPKIEWFLGGKLNITENCLDRHLETLGDKTAILWEPNDPREPNRTLTYNDLFHEVCRFSNVLKILGIQKGDRVCLYMPMIPELVVAVLACARIGAIHSVVFAGFSARALADRIQDASCRLVITTDGGHRGSKTIALKDIVDEAFKTCPSVQNCVVYKHTDQNISWQKGRDLWWHDLMAKAKDDCEPETMDSEDPLFILYTS